MKKITSIIAGLLFTCFAFAQSTNIDIANRELAGSIENSYEIVLPDVEVKDAENQWQALMKDYNAKTKNDRKTKSLKTEAATIPSISSGPVDMYARFDKYKKVGTTMTVWVKADGDFVSEDSDASVSVGRILETYINRSSKFHAQQIADAEAKLLEDLQKDLQKLMKDRENYEENIEKAKAAIAKNEKDIELNKLDQEKKAAEIEAQKKNLEAAKSRLKIFN